MIKYYLYLYLFYIVNFFLSLWIQLAPFVLKDSKEAPRKAHNTIKEKRKQATMSHPDFINVGDLVCYLGIPYSCVAVSEDLTKCTAHCAIPDFCDPATINQFVDNPYSLYRITEMELEYMKKYGPRKEVVYELFAYVCSLKETELSTYWDKTIPRISYEEYLAQQLEHIT